MPASSPKLFKCPNTLVKKSKFPPIHDHWAWLLDTKVWHTFDFYGDLVDFNSLEISGLITKSLWFLQNAFTQHMYEKFTIDFSYHCQQNLLKNYIHKS